MDIYCNADKLYKSPLDIQPFDSLQLASNNNKKKSSSRILRLCSCFHFLGQVNNKAASRVNQLLAGSLVTNLRLALVSFVMQQKINSYISCDFCCFYMCSMFMCFFHVNNKIHCCGDTCCEDLNTGKLRQA